MRSAVSLGVVLSLAAVAGCAEPQGARGDPAPVSEQSAEAASMPLPWPGDIDLVELKNVGDVPAAARTTTVVLRSNGDMLVNGEPGDADALAGALRATGPVPEAGGARDHDVLLVLDGDLRWRPIQTLMQVCAVEHTSRLFFAARHAESGEPGAIATFLPRDGGVRPASHRPKEKPMVAARTSAKGEQSDPAGLAVVVERVRESSRAEDLGVMIDARPTTPVHLVLRLVDEAASGGAATIGFTGTPPAGQLSISEDVVALAAKPAAQHVVALNTDLPPGDAARSVPERVRGGFAGFAESELVLARPETVEEVEVPVLEDGEPR